MEPSSTRQELRRELGIMSNMFFYNKYENGYVPVTGTPTTTKVNCSDSLFQNDGFWTHSYAYFVSGVCEGMFREIAGFVRQNGTLILDYPLPSAPSASDQIEITGRWSPAAIHKALNYGIREGQKAYPDTVIDESLVVRENVLEYDLTDLTRIPWQIRQIYLEDGVASACEGNPVTGASDYITTSLSFSDDEYNGYHLSIYSGTGSGQLRTISDCTATDGKLIVSEAFDTTPATDSKFKVWSSSEQLATWTPLRTVLPDKEEFPTKIWIDSGLSRWNGYRIRLVYLSLPEELTADSDITYVPKDFVCHKALSYLHDRMIGLTDADKALHGDASELHDQIAELYRQKNPSRSIPAMMREPMTGYPSTILNENPLGW